MCNGMHPSLDLLKSNLIKSSFLTYTGFVSELLPSADGAHDGTLVMVRSRHLLGVVLVSVLDAD